MAAPLSGHARYGSRLAALRADEAILPPVVRAAERLSLAAGGRRLERDYARFHPHRDPFATLVLRDLRDPVLCVEAYDARPVARGAREAVVAGLLRIYSVHRRLAKAVRVAGSLRADGDARARRHLKRALDELEREAA